MVFRLVLSLTCFAGGAMANEWAQLLSANSIPVEAGIRQVPIVESHGMGSAVVNSKCPAALQAAIDQILSERQWLSWEQLDKSGLGDSKSRTCVKGHLGRLESKMYISFTTFRDLFDMNQRLAVILREWWGPHCRSERMRDKNAHPGVWYKYGLHPYAGRPVGDIPFTIEYYRYAEDPDHRSVVRLPWDSISSLLHDQRALLVEQSKQTVVDAPISRDERRIETFESLAGKVAANWEAAGMNYDSNRFSPGFV